MITYSQLTAAQRLQFISDFRSFANDTMPKLQTAAKGEWTEQNTKDMENGLNLIQAFPYAVDFAQKSLLLRDYRNRVPRLAFYVDKIKTQISGDMAAGSSSAEQTQSNINEAVNSAKTEAKENLENAVKEIKGDAPDGLDTLGKVAKELQAPTNSPAATVLDKSILYREVKTETSDTEQKDS